MASLLVSRPSERKTSARTARGFCERLEKRLEPTTILSQTRDEPGSKPLVRKSRAAPSSACLSVVSGERTLGLAFLSWNSTRPTRCALGRALSDASKASSIASMPFLPSPRRASDILLVKSRTNTISRSMFSAVLTEKLVSV